MFHEKVPPLHAMKTAPVNVLHRIMNHLDSWCRFSCKLRTNGPPIDFSSTFIDNAVLNIFDSHLQPVFSVQLLVRSVVWFSNATFCTLRSTSTALQNVDREIDPCFIYTIAPDLASSTHDSLPLPANPIWLMSPSLCQTIHWLEHRAPLK